MRRKKGPKSLNSRLIFFIILCWAVPILIFFTFITFSYREGIIEKSDEMIEARVRQTADLISIRINEAINLCQKPSYEKIWEANYDSYRKGYITKADYIQKMNITLTKRFHVDSRFSQYAFYDVDSDVPDCHSSRVGSTLSSYLEDINPEVLEIKESGTNYTTVKIIGERVFIVRNLYTVSGYRPFGTLVIELNKSRLTRDIDKSDKEKIAILINDTSSMITFFPEEEAKMDLLYDMVKGYSIENKNNIVKAKNRVYNGYMFEKTFEHHHIGVILISPIKEVYASLYNLYDLIAIILLLFIPVIMFSVVFLKKHIRVPVATLVKASKEIERGNIGFEIDKDSMPNEEFQYLMNSFNSMSSQVKYLFDYVYDEKLAKKDAQILALQAQINPHFLNNTLEMMNWQARMSGDIIVSKMIESLGTVLDYRMNRSSVKEIHLVEELKCADAYFYIMSMRFGQRLQIAKDIDEEMLYMNVPPLILQPLIENAIVHGVETVKNGTISLHIYHSGEQAYFKVKNSGKKLGTKELERIEHLLTGDESKIPKGQGKHTSIGIRNVNQRIKLVYGDEYGLSIYQEEELTVSEITIPYKKPASKNGEEERFKVETELKNIREMKNKG